MLSKLARARRTVRRFSPEPPPLTLILQAIEAAKEAPSGMNAQPWHFLVVTDPGIKQGIREACEAAERRFHARVQGKLKEWLQEKGFTPDKPFLTDAPYLILVFARTDAPYWLQSTWLAIGYLLLALEEEGLGTVTYTPPDPTPVQTLLAAPKGCRLQTILPVGYPADPKPKYPRKALSEVASLDGFSKPISEPPARPREGGSP